MSLSAFGRSIVMAAVPAILAAGTTPAIQRLSTPERGFFSKILDYHGIPIKAHADVSDEALLAAYGRLDMELQHLPVVVKNLAAAGAELHIIGRHQVTTDLPEWRVDKHVPLDEYDGLTRDERTRGMGGLLTSCGEENLLRLPKDQDHYFGRDICIHEFAHEIHGCGLDHATQALITRQAAQSKAKGLWLDSYAGSNEFEFFAELTMWYFGTHGDMHIRGTKPAPGPEGLKAYDPDAYRLLDDLYQGRIPVATTTYHHQPEDGFDWVPQDSRVARGIVAKLGAYRTGATTLEAFRKDAGLDGAQAPGWHVEPLGKAGTFRVQFRDPKGKDHALAHLDFKEGRLSEFAWEN
jgi:hypothetical protein